MPGEGRVPLTLPIMMIDPPPGWPCMTALAACATCSGAIRFSSMTLAWNRGDAVAAAAGGDPPALLITTSTRPKRSAAVRDQPLRLPGVPHVGPDEGGGAARPRRAARPRSVRPHTSTCGAGRQERPRDARADAPGAAGDDHGPARVIGVGTWASC